MALTMTQCPRQSTGKGSYSAGLVLLSLVLMSSPSSAGWRACGAASDSVLGAFSITGTKWFGIQCVFVMSFLLLVHMIISGSPHSGTVLEQDLGRTSLCKFARTPWFQSLGYTLKMSLWMWSGHPPPSHFPLGHSPPTIIFSFNLVPWCKFESKSNKLLSVPLIVKNAIFGMTCDFFLMI